MQEIDEVYYRFLIGSVVNKNCGELKFEFLGILKDFALYEDKKSLAFLEYLIECNVYIEVKEMPYHLVCFDIAKEEQRKDVDLHYMDAFHYNDRIYIYNMAIYSDIYKLSQYVIECRLKWVFKDDIFYLISELNGFINDEDKIEFLKEKLKFYWKPNENTSSFLLFMNKMQDAEGETWEEEMITCMVEDPIFDLFFLTGSNKIELNDSSFYNNYFRLWVEYYRKRRLIEFCTNKIAKIDGSPNLRPREFNKENINQTSLRKIKSDLIFKDNNEILFDFIVNSYASKKNNAFFSYLFHFFSDNGFLLKQAKSSIVYNSFLVENNFIEKFSKVIQRVENNSLEEQRMFQIFNKAVDKFLK